MRFPTSKWVYTLQLPSEAEDWLHNYISDFQNVDRERVIHQIQLTISPLVSTAMQ